MGELQRVRREDAVAYSFGIAEPQLRVAQGEQFVLETRDSPDGRIRSTSDLFDEATLGEVLTLGYNNPCAGPVYVAGAQPGDTLVVDIVDILPALTGFVATEGNLGPLLGTKYLELQEHFTEMVEHRPGPSGTTSDGTAHLTNGTSWPLEPMIGCMGVVPARPEQGNDTLTMQTSFGGNLDSTDIKKGHRIYYPVAHEGALLYAGDVQGSQATEFAGTANEVEAEVVLSCEVLKGVPTPFVRIETPTHLIQLASYRPFEYAVKQAYLWLLDWLVESYGVSPRKAVTHFNGNPEVRVRVYCTSLGEKTKGSVGVCFPKSAIASSRA